MGFVIFSILYFTPADPTNAILGANATLDEKENLRHQLGIDRPYHVQLADYLYQTFVQFDFGKSWTYSRPVFDELGVRIPRTLTVGLIAMVINLTIGISLGVFAGTNAGKWKDSLIMGIIMVFIAAPNFWVALLMVLLFSSKLGWLPAYGLGGWQYYVMPVISSAIAGIAVNARFARNSIVEVIREEYVTTARAKGVREKNVVYRHMLPNALMPTITNIGKSLASIIGGSPVIEQVFSFPGVGLLMLTAINNRDYPTIRACVLFFAIAVSIIMLTVDLIYAAIDPRIKARFSSGKGI
jgi:peptide/nickel transport system permease protein